VELFFTAWHPFADSELAVAHADRQVELRSICLSYTDLPFLEQQRLSRRGWISIIMLVFINIIFAAFSFEFFEKHVLS